MRKIEVKTWKAILKGEEIEEGSLMLFTSLLSSASPEEMPKGLDQFRLFNRISKAFEGAEKTKVLSLEEGDYSFMKAQIEKNIPAILGMNANITEAIDAFINAKQE